MNKNNQQLSTIICHIRSTTAVVNQQISNNPEPTMIHGPLKMQKICAGFPKCWFVFLVWCLAWSDKKWYVDSYRKSGPKYLTWSLANHGPLVFTITREPGCWHAAVGHKFHAPSTTSCNSILQCSPLDHGSYVMVKICSTAVLLKRILQ